MNVCVCNVNHNYQQSQCDLKEILSKLVKVKSVKLQSLPLLNGKRDSFSIAPRGINNVDMCVHMNVQSMKIILRSCSAGGESSNSHDEHFKF